MILQNLFTKIPKYQLRAVATLTSNSHQNNELSEDNDQVPVWPQKKVQVSTKKHSLNYLWQNQNTKPSTALQLARGWYDQIDAIID